MSDSLSLRCLYYPYARSVDPRTLKRLILLFDEIWFSDPVGESQRDLIMRYDPTFPLSVINQWDDVRSAVDKMVELGIVRIHDPRSDIENNERLLTAALREDMYDDEIWRACTQQGMPATWSMLRKRIPDSAFGFLGSQVSHRVTNVTSVATKAFHEDGKSFPDWLRSTYYDGGVDWAIRNRVRLPESGISGYGTRAPDNLNEIIPNPDEVACVFPFPTGSSLAVNQAAVVADAHGLVPLTDSPVHHGLLMRKYERAKESAEGGEFAGMKAFHPEKIRRVSLAILEELVPGYLLEQLSVNDALRYRQASAKSFERLKEYLAQIAAEIESQPWDDDFEKEIHKAIYGKVVPEARVARDSAIEVYENLFGSTAKKVGPMAATTLGAGSYVGLSLPQLLLLGSASTAGAMYPELIDAYAQRRKGRRNSLTYLLDLNAPTKRRRWWRRVFGN